MLLDQKLPPPYMIAEDDIIPESEFQGKIAKNIPVRIAIKVILHRDRSLHNHALGIFPGH